MPELMLFTDSSLDPQTRIGYGAYLALTEPGLALPELSAQVKLRRFVETSSTPLELQTLLWALSELPESAAKLSVYTDSQNIIGLPARRARLEQNDYRSAKHKRLGDYLLYQEFYRQSDRLAFELIKLQGHKLAAQKDDVDRLFTLVDRAARAALRAWSRSRG